ncbi:hypothetical protein [Gloeothece verrucosa]|uniref:Uncharacterized protein n=1 Tax=Gloeothece verrucosa (strain PCC 7822) TaxID=497965 RepID=E0UMN1_GLOV7|nr:hypothetical protein [Gloeothece verrucosa]ADN18211.1 hypothetical protein Cyan7822_6427 [Gloeothece verrucosa PCC 7822]
MPQHPLSVNPGETKEGQENLLKVEGKALETTFATSKAALNSFQFLLKTIYDLLAKRSFEQNKEEKQEHLEQRRQSQPGDRVTMHLGMNKIYDSSDPEVKITPRQAVLVEQALKNPEQFEGRLTINVNDEPVYQVVRGQVIKDDLKLSEIFQQPNKTLEIQPENALSHAPANGQERSLDKLLEALTKQQQTIEQLQQTNSKLVEKIDKMDQTLQAYGEHIKTIQHPQLAKHLREQTTGARNFLKSGIEQLKQFFGQALANLQQKFNDFRQERAIKTLDSILTKYGKEDEGGNLTLTGNNYQIIRDKNTGKIDLISQQNQNKVIEQNQLTPQASLGDLKALNELSQTVEAQSQTQTQALNLTNGRGSHRR